MKLSLLRTLWLVMVLGVCLVAVQYRMLYPLMESTHPKVLDDGTQVTATAGVDQLPMVERIVAVLIESSRYIAHKVRTILDIKGNGNAVYGPSTMPFLYIITPTYRRPEQIAELTRLAQTLMHIPNLHWLVIEDSRKRTPGVTRLLIRTGMSYSQLLAPMPKKYKEMELKPKGVSNRNRGLRWLRKNAKSGVFYFADDDNTYDLDLFREMRSTKKVSMWPVGLCTEYGLCSPVVRNGILVGFYGWIAGRKFPVDMAGFAVNVEFLLQRPNARMPYVSNAEESGFLRSLAPFEVGDIELHADYCTRIRAWHTQTVENEWAVKIDLEMFNNTNLVQLSKLVV